jgi:hypothetical protein
VGCAKSGVFAVFILSRFCSVVRAAKPAAALDTNRFVGQSVLLKLEREYGPKQANRTLQNCQLANVCRLLVVSAT